MSNETKRWTPVLEGKRFCSPGCGGGCTLAAHDLAWSEARALAKRLGRGWEPRVWENLGWHFSVTEARGYLKVRPSAGRGWTAFLGERGAGGRWVCTGRTPQSAVAAVRAAAREEIQKIERYLDEAKTVRAIRKARGET